MNDKFQEIRIEFMDLVSKCNRKEAVAFSLDVVGKIQIPLIDYYEHVLTPVMRQLDDFKTEMDYILKEHLRTALVRAIIENLSHTYVGRDNLLLIETGQLQISANGKRPRVLLYSPSEEYHEIGLRMAEDIFEINGCDVIYPGPNFPREELKVAFDMYEFDALVMSITTPYNLVTGHKTCTYLLSKIPDIKARIYCAGVAFNSLNEKMLFEEIHQCHIAGVLNSLYDVERVARELLL